MYKLLQESLVKFLLGVVEKFIEEFLREFLKKPMEEILKIFLDFIMKVLVEIPSINHATQEGRGDQQSMTTLSQISEAL